MSKKIYILSFSFFVFLLVLFLLGGGFLNSNEQGLVKGSKQEILEQIKNSPNSIKKEQLNNYSKINIEGEITRLLATNRNNETKTEIIKTNNGNNYEIYYLQGVDMIEPGSKVRISAYEVDGVMVVENIEQIEPPLKEYTGQFDILAITFNWNNDTSEPFTRAQIVEKLFTNSDSTDNYIQDNSFNNVTFTGDINNITDEWYTLAYNEGAGCTYSGPGNDLSNWTAAANTAAANDGYTLGNYDRILYIFPDNPSCGWAGLGQAPGTLTWYNGFNNSSVYSHELGHNFGAGHSGDIDCGTEVIDTYASCSTTVYGDDYDVMGNVSQSHMNAVWKNVADWIPDNKVRNVTTSGTYTIEDIETSATGYQAIKIEKANTSDYYWFEYRQAVGQDAGLPAGVTRGLIGRIYTNAFDSPSYLYWDTFILDFTPENGWSDIALSDGSSFVDAENNITITQVSSNSDSVTVSIDFGPLDPVYRFWSPGNKSHFYTASESEKNKVIATWPTEWLYEGVAYYANKNQVGSNRPVYRFWSPGNKSHFYTASESEKNKVIATWPTEWLYEGVVYYAYKNYEAGLDPIYRFWSPGNKSHFYTASESEKNKVIATWPTEWLYEGVTYYANK